jgi:Zn-dependent protease with chaperone function/tetratricopeptide (TPR) repeat protein
MNTTSATPGDKPLSGSSRAALFCAAGGAILLSYLLSFVASIIVVVVIAFQFVFLVAAIRFGGSALIARAMEGSTQLLLIFVRSFWLRKGAEYRVALHESDAPNLFARVRALCLKADVEMPREISVEMTVNAWVRLRGYRRGKGETTLGIGYDLLAGLTEREMEGVLAHEITHAKLVQRGYKSWLNRGLARMGQLAWRLSARVEGCRRIKKSPGLAGMLFNVADRHTRLAARLVAACSRQDEFDADRGAAALCGAGAIRSSLLKLDPLAERARRLPWNERVARLQLGEGFTHWLVDELASASFAPAQAEKPNLFFKYSTHPSIADRLAALPSDAGDSPNQPVPAINLLANPDKVAETLISEIQKVAAEEERKDSRRLKRWTRGNGARMYLHPLQTLGLLLAGIGGGTGLIIWLVVGPSTGLLCFTLAAMSVGAFAHRFFRYRERLSLPVPEFAQLRAPRGPRAEVTDAWVKEREAELNTRVSKLRRKKRELELASVAYEALGRRDYVMAHIAARLCLKVNNKSIEGAIGMAVSAAALGQITQVHQVLNFLQRVTGMKIPSASWGAGWALALCGDWEPAEAFLEKRSQQTPAHPTVLLMLAYCQSKRGKLQNAVSLARQVCSASTPDTERTKFLIDLLLGAGYLAEAREQLRRLESSISDDAELILMMARVSLLLKDLAAAEQWTQLLKEKNAGAHFFVRLGQLHETARQNAKAVELYGQALENGFYPEALVGLGRLEAEAQNKEQARKHLLAALDVDRPLPEKAAGPLPLFHPVLRQLLALHPPVSNCRAWVATLNGGVAPRGLEHKSLLIFAPDRQQAEASLYTIFTAMQPKTPPPPPACVGWVEGRREQQPDGPVLAGVQCVLN